MNYTGAISQIFAFLLVINTAAAETVCAPPAVCEDDRQDASQLQPLQTNATSTLQVVQAATGLITPSADSQPSSFQKDPLAASAPSVAPYTIANAPPLEWEDGHPERKAWSDYAYAVINANFDQLNNAQDMNLFCPNYKTLTHDQQVMAWAQIFVGISHYESSWDPTNRTFEDQGTDPITGKPVYSEGLLQLSYQDQEQWGSFCKFDWDQDKNLSADDPKKSILNPYENLYCGIRVMAKITTDKKAIVVPKGGYWSTISSRGKNSQLTNIISEVRSTLPVCGPPVKADKLHAVFTKFANWKINRQLVKIVRELGSSGKPSAPATPTDSAPAQ